LFSGHFAFSILYNHTIEQRQCRNNASLYHPIVFVFLFPTLNSLFFYNFVNSIFADVTLSYILCACLFVAWLYSQYHATKFSLAKKRAKLPNKEEQQQSVVV